MATSGRSCEPRWLGRYPIRSLKPPIPASLVCARRLYAPALCISHRDGYRRLRNIAMGSDARRFHRSGHRPHGPDDFVNPNRCLPPNRPELIAEIEVDTAFEHGRWRHPVRYPPITSRIASDATSRSRCRLPGRLIQQRIPRISGSSFSPARLRFPRPGLARNGPTNR
jgi:hypothetical protein